MKTLVSASGPAARERKPPSVRVAPPPIVIPTPPRAVYQIHDAHERRAYTFARRAGLSRSSAAWAAENRHELAAPAIVGLMSVGVVALVWWLTHGDGAAPRPPGRGAP